MENSIIVQAIANFDQKLLEGINQTEGKVLNKINNHN